MALASANLGRAHGTIDLDTSSLRGAVATVRGVSQQMEKELNRAGTGADRVASRFDRISKSIRGMQGQAAGFAAVMGIISGLGIATASSFQDSRIMLEAITGSAEKASKILDDARKKAFEWGRPTRDVLKVYTSMLPLLKGNVAEMDKWVGLAGRLKVLMPTEDAAFALRELQSGDLESVVSRFNIPRSQLRAAFADTNDWGEALDRVLTSMGITDEAAKAMGTSFRSSGVLAKEAMQELMAEGFAPILDILTPILLGAAKLATTLRAGHPEAVKFAAGFVLIAGTAASTLLIVERIITALRALQVAGIFSAISGGLGRVGRGLTSGVGGRIAGGIGGAAAGAAVGLGLGNVIAKAQGKPEQNWDDVFLTFRKAVFILVGNLHFAGAAITRGFANVVATMIEAAAKFAGFVGLTGAEMRANAAATSVRDAAEVQVEMDRQRVIKLKSNLGLATEEQTLTSAQIGERNAAATSAENIKQAELDFYQGLQEIERDAASARLQATEDFERQRADTIRDYNLQAAREVEDYARSSLRAAADLARSIDEVREESARREAEAAEEMSIRLAEAREDSEERIAEITEKYNKDRERAELDHKDRLLTAVARLDVTAIWEEQRSHKRRTADAKESFEDQVSDQKDSLREREEDEQKRFARALSLARAADDRRIADMQESFSRQKAMEDEDRAIRLARQAEDHASTLSEQERAHGDRLAQINRQAGEERASLEEAFLLAMEAEGKYNEQWKRLQDARRDAAKKAVDEWWDYLNDKFKTRLSPQGERTPWADPRGFAVGGPVRRTGLAMVHAGEYVMTAAERQAGAVASGAVAALAGANISVHIGGSTNMGAGEMQAVVESAFSNILHRLGQRGGQA